MNWSEDKRKEKSGFIDYQPPIKSKQCMHPNHNPPGMIVLKPGTHTYKCPACGEITVIDVPLITC